MTEKHGHGGGWEMELLPLLLQSILAVPYLGSSYTYYGIPIGAQYATLQKLFSHASSVILLFSNPAPKTKNGTANRRETINRKACGWIIMIGQSKQGAPARSDPIYYTIYRAGTRLWCAFYQSEKTLQLWWVKSAYLHFSLFHCTVQGHILRAQLGTNCTMPLSYTCSTWMQH